MVLRNVAKTFSLEEQRQEINLIAQDLHDLATNYVSVESDPIFTASVAAGISSTDVTNWNTAYSWGDHAQAGYLTAASLGANVANWDAAYGWGDHSQAGYLTSETDPVFAASDAAAVTAAKISNWDNAYSWGDHSLSGYATQTFVNTALTNLNNWDTAYSWGDHSAAGYITNISSFSIGDLSDVDVTTSAPQNQETLFWSGTNWVPGPIPQTGIEYTDLSVVVSSTPFGNGNLTYNDSLGEFTFTPPATFSGSYNDLSNTPNIPSQLNDLSDVIVAGTINNNDVISWDGAHWTPTPLSSLGGGIALTNLSVTVNAPGNPNLSYNNTTGVFSYTPPDLSAYLTSVAINLSEISDVNISGTPANNAVLKYSTSTNQWELAVDDNDPGLALTDFSVSNNSASGGGSLAYNNTSGVFSFTPPVLPSQLNNFTDVNISGTPANGDILKFNASTSQWELGQESTPQTSAGEPVGTIAAWAGGVSSIPSGWLLCDGSLISRTTYADLFASIGTYHGGGDGSTSFTLPDLRNKFIVGAHSDQGTGQVFDVGSGSVSGHYAPGDTGGEVAHKLTIAEMPQHSHTEVGWSFQHTAANPGPGGAGTSSNNNSGLAGGDNYHENRPPYFALCWIVKALPGAASTNSGGGGGSGGGGSIDLTAFSVNVATAGTANLSYNNLTGVFTYTPPDLSGYSTFSGSYNDLTDKPNIPQSLNDLLDVVISGTPADGAVIKYNSSNSRWELGSDTGTGSSGGGSLPIGSIIMWSGDTSSIPTGWQLCDGTNGTPDLRNRFVIGAGDTYPVGNTGGNADSVVVEHSHTINDHNHTFSGSGSDNVDISVSGTTGNQSQSHNHSFTTNTTGNHRHDGTVPTPLYVPSGDTDRGTESSIFSADNSQTQITTFAGDHNHSGTTGGQSDDHNHSFSGSGSDTVNISVSGTTGVQSDSGTSTAGSSGTGTNIPPYYALCFIYCVTPGGGTTTGATDLDDLTDVVITSPTTGQVLKYNGTNWVNDTDATSSGGSGIALTDLSVTTNSVGTAALSYNNTTGVFSYTPPDLSAYLTSVSINIGDINNVAATTPNDGDVLTWNASLSTWQPAAASGGASGSGTTHQWADGVEASGWSASDLSDYMFNGNLSLFAKAETSGTDYLGWDNSANGANLPVLNGPVEIFIRYADVGNYTYEVNGVTVTPDLTGVDTNGDWITLTSGTAGSFRVTAPSTSSNIQIAGVKSNGLVLTPTALYGGSSGGGSTFNLDANLNTSTASAGEILSWNGTDYEWVADQTGSGASAFTSLTDTPSTLTADKWIKVNSAGDGIEFVDAPSGGSGGGSGVIVPPGTVMSWAGDQNSIPSGYQLCDGSAVSRTVYSDLYLAIGDTHGAGDGSTTFNLPDLRNRFIVGEGSSYATAATGGSADATLVSHSHNINNHTHSFSGSGSDTVNISVSGTTGNQSANHTHVFTTDTQGNHNHQWGTDDNLGAGGGTNNPDANGGQAWKGTTSTNGAHSHSGTTSGVSNNHNHTFSGSGSDNVSISVSGTTGNPSNTGTDSQGSSATGANLPPYYALCYIIKMDAYAASGGGGSSYTDSDVNAHLNTSSASSGQILSWDGSDFVWVDDQTGGSGSGTGITDGDKGDITVSSSGSTWTIDDGVISTAKIATGAVNSGKLATNSVTSVAIEAGAVTIAKIGASGTPDATTFLRGDGNWVIPPSSGSGIALTDLSVNVNSPGTANFTYSNSTGVFTYTPPDLSAYSTFSGSYNDLTDKPTLFSGSYDDLTNKPVQFSGDYNDLTNKPTVPSGIDDLNDVTISAVSNGSPADGDVLTWSTSSGQWVNQQPSGGGGSSSSGGGGIALLPTQTIDSAAQATSVEFTNIPSDALEITVMFEGVSLSGTDDFEIQLGTSSGYIVSNYDSMSQNEGGSDKRNSTSSFILRSDVGSRTRTGSMLIKKASDTSYVQTGQFAITPSSTIGGNQTYGSLSSVSGTVNKLRIKSDSGQYFDAGSISVSYKTAGSASTTAPADDSPVGVISMWAGSTSSIPDGWQLCDGGSAATSELQSVVGSTVPDLRDKFIVGAGNTYSVGNTGGSPNAVVVEHSHTGESHAHGINTSFNISASGTTSTDDVPHTHPIAGTVGTGSGLNAGADYTGNYSPRSTNAATDTNHSHTFSINTTASLSGSTENGGGGNTGVEGVNAEGKNLPPYYSLCYIIKNDASLYLKSPNGTSFRLSVDNSGNVSATSV